MSVTATVYAKARSEIIALFRWDADILSPDQMLRLDCAVALRLALDDLQGRVIRGESIDMNRMLTASEALARLLPPAVLASPPPEHREDPRKALLEIILRMKERGEIGDRADEPSLREEIAALRTENETLRRAARAAGAPPVTPREADVTPPSELGEFFRGPPRPGPDDPKPPVTIEGKATAAPAYDYDANSDWKSYVNSDGSIRSTPRGRWDI